LVSPQQTVSLSMEKSRKTLDKLVFAFNAKSGILNGLADSVHKSLSPETYSCNLCAITHHRIGMRFQLKEFLRKKDLDYIFLHKNDIAEYSGVDSSELPFVGKLKRGNVVEVIIDKEEIAEIAKLTELIKAIQNKLKVKSGP